jgi:hypothetical protein
MNCIAFSFPRCSDSNLTSTTCLCFELGASPSNKEEIQQKRRIDAIYDSDFCKFVMMIPLANVYCCLCSLALGKWSEINKEIAGTDMVVKPCVLCNSVLWVVYQFQDLDLPTRDSEYQEAIAHRHGQRQEPRQEQRQEPKQEQRQEQRQAPAENPIHHENDSIDSLNFSGIGREVSIVAEDDDHHQTRDVKIETRCCKSAINIANRTKYNLIVIYKTDLNALQVKDVAGGLSVGDKSGSLDIKRTGMKAKTSKTQINPGQTVEILSRTAVVYVSIGRISTDRKSLVIMTEEMHVKAGSLITISPSLLTKTVSVIPI